MIPINSVQIGLPSKTATHLLVRPIINSTTDLSCNTYFELISKNEIWEDVEYTNEEGNTITTPTLLSKTEEVLQSGNHQLTEEEYNLWGSSNEIIENIVLNYLGLTRLQP